MSLPAYPDYKASGVDWLGEVPAHWDVVRLRFVAELNPSKSETSGWPRDTEVSFVPMEAIGEDGSLSLDRSRTIQEVEAGYTYFRDGDVTIAKITPCFENGKGALMRGLVGGVGFGTTELIVVRPTTGKSTGAYLNWVFRSTSFRHLGEASMYGAGGQKRVPDDFVRNLELPLPPVSEQSAVSHFLDHETAKIDALIAEQEKLIALLAEKRQATISHAVTRGLDPDAPMKDSGVAWLGSVPAHWEIKSIRHVLEAIGDVDHYMPASVEKGVPYLMTGDLKDLLSSVDLDACKQVSYDDYLDLTKKIRSTKGDVVMARYATIGTLMYVDNEADFLVSYSCVTLRPKHSEISGRHLFQYMKSDAFRQGVEHQVNTNTQGNVGIKDLQSLKVAVPPLDEQEAIVAFLDSEAKSYDALEAESKRAVELLKERRSALITAAVTGQIDVRGAAGAAQDQPQPTGAALAP